MNTIKKEEEEINETEPVIEQKTEDIFEETNVENKVEFKEDENKEVESLDEKPKRKRTMTPKAKAQLDKARLKSNVNRRKQAEERKKKKEEKDLTNEKYINEIDNLKEQVKQLIELNNNDYESEEEEEEEQQKTTKYQNEIQELKNQINEIKNMKTQKVKIKKDITTDNRFNMEDLDYYAKEYHRKMIDKTKEINNKNRDQIRNRFFYNLR